MTATPKKNNKILIVGQGIAGTLLSYFFLKNNLPFHVIDQPLPGASSSVAAGIINPITGRRMVKSWRFEELSAFARSTYHQIGQFLGISIYQDKNILRALPTIFEENEWERRSGFPENRAFFCKTADLENYEAKVKPTHAWGKISGAAQVDMPLLISTFRRLLMEKGLITEEIFDYQQIEISPTHVCYQNVPFHKIIFCEGAKATQNPYFEYLPFAPSKGESLTVKISGLQAVNLLKNKIYLVPLKNGTFWIGSSNSFDYREVEPTSGMYDYLQSSLKDTLSVPFKALSHTAGIRPTVADKRPLIGFHPKYPSLGIFNGLGTKGASLGPFFANQMLSLLLNETPVDREVDIKRFDHLLEGSLSNSFGRIS